MREKKLSIARKAMIWWLSSPGNPYVCLSVAYDFSPAQEYLAALERDHGRSVTVQHLLAAAIGRVLRALPEANARLVGHRIFMRDRVPLAMPVDLLSTPGAGGLEVSMAVVPDVAGRSLVEIADSCRGAVKAERTGQGRPWWVSALMSFVHHTPYPLLDGALRLLDAVGRRPSIGRWLYAELPGSGVTNPGAVFKGVEGMVFRAASWEIPQKLMHVGTVWGVSSVQDEVIAVAGQPAVRPMLPVVLCFDHRLIDGVKAGRMLVRLCEILQHPADELGADGSRRPS